jgi:uncharacterized protein YuzE
MRLKCSKMHEPHALDRMMQRNISEQQVKDAVLHPDRLYMYGKGSEMELYKIGRRRYIASVGRVCERHLLHRDSILERPMSRNSLHIEPDFVPEVVIDSEAGAAYVKFAEGRVSKTMNVCEGDVMANIDLDAGGRIVGLKVVGTHEFNLRRLIEVAGLRDFFTEEIIADMFGATPCRRSSLSQLRSRNSLVK